MGKQRRKFETGFQQQIVQEVESGLLSVSAASRKYQISGSVIDRWRRQARQALRSGLHKGRIGFLELENQCRGNGGALSQKLLMLNSIRNRVYIEKSLWYEISLRKGSS
jgi:transposase-like protein